MAFLTKRKDSWYIYWTQDGVKRGRSLKTNLKTVAEQYLKEFEYKLATKQLGQSTDVTLERLAQEYLQDAKTTRTLRTFESHIEPRVRSFVKAMHEVGITKLSQVNRRHIADYQNRRLGEVSAMTAMHDLYAVSAMFSYAVQSDYTDTNVLKSVKKVKPEKNPPRFLSDQELQKVFDLARPTHLWTVVATAYYAGLRNSELCFLEWNDIDFDTNLITVRNKPGFTLKGKEARSIPLNSKLDDILLPFRRNSGFCFRRANGEQFEFRLLSQQFHKLIVKPSGLPHFSLHTLRHSFASHLAMAGVSIFKVSQWLGHKDVSTTMIYAHLAPQDGEINKI